MPSEFGTLFFLQLVLYVTGDYNLTVLTEGSGNAGTDCNIMIKVFGPNAESDLIAMKTEPLMPKSKRICQLVSSGDDVDQCCVEYLNNRFSESTYYIDGNFGSPRQLEIRLYAYPNPNCSDWHLNKVRVYYVEKEEQSIFTCKCWYEGGNGTIFIGRDQDGGYSAWSSWGECIGKCGSAMRYRLRQCNNPPKSMYGADCQGQNIMSETCVPASCLDSSIVQPSSSVPSSSSVQPTSSLELSSSADDSLSGGGGTSAAPTSGGEGDTSVAPTSSGEGDTSVAPTSSGKGETSVAPTSGGKGDTLVDGGTSAAPTSGGEGGTSVAPTSGGKGDTLVDGGTSAAPTSGGEGDNLVDGGTSTVPTSGGKGDSSVAPTSGGEGDTSVALTSSSEGDTLVAPTSGGKGDTSWPMATSSGQESTSLTITSEGGELTSAESTSDGRVDTSVASTSSSKGDTSPTSGEGDGTSAAPMTSIDTENNSLTPLSSIDDSPSSAYANCSFYFEYFVCTKDERASCIHWTRLCDDIEDCDDGQDEKRETCEKHYWVSMAIPIACVLAAIAAIVTGVLATWLYMAYGGSSGAAVVLTVYPSSSPLIPTEMPGNPVHSSVNITT